MTGTPTNTPIAIPASAAKPVKSVWGLLDRYPALPGHWQAMVFAYLGATLTLLPAASRRTLDARVFATAAIAASFLLGATFAVRSIDPIRPALYFTARYLTVALPMMIVVVGVVLARILEASRWPARFAPSRTGPLAAMLVILSVLTYTREFPGFERHPMVRLTEYRRTAGPAFDACIPIVSRDRFGRSAIWVYLSLIWNGYAGLEPGERFPSIRHVRPGGTGKKLWLARCPKTARRLFDPAQALWQTLLRGEVVWVRSIRAQEDGFLFELETAESARDRVFGTRDPDRG